MIAPVSSVTSDARKFADVRAGLRPLALLLLACVLVGQSPGECTAQASGIPGSLSVVFSPGDLGRTAEIIPNVPFSVFVVIDDLTNAYPPDLRGVQFRVVVDPRLTILSKTPTPQVLLYFEVAPGEWLLSFQGCLTPADEPAVVMQYLLMLPQENAGAEDLRVELGDLAVFGEPMLLSACSDPSLILRAPNGGGVLINPSSPAIVHLSGSAPVVVEGRDLNLSWRTARASSTLLDDSPVDSVGSIIRRPTVDHVYHLEAQAGSSTVDALYPVEVIREPRVLAFTATLVRGENSSQANLSWDVLGALAVSLGGIGSVHPRGGQVVPIPDPPVFDLEASNEWGVTRVQAELTGLADEPPVIIAFNASQNPFTWSIGATLSWTLLGAESARIDPEVGLIDPTSGTVQVQPNNSTSYTLSATNQNGNSTAAIVLELAKPVIRTFSVNPLAYVPGDSTTVGWELQGAETAELRPGLGSIDPRSGQLIVGLTDQTYLQILATNPAGTTSESRSLTVLVPAINSFTATSSKVYPHTMATLKWVTTGTPTLWIEPDIGPVHGPIGSILTPVDTDPSTFTLFAASASDTFSASVQVGWKPPFVQLFGSPLHPQPGELVSLVVKVSGADTVTLEPGFGSIPPHDATYTLTVEQPTTFVLSAANEKGTASVQTTITPAADPRPIAQLTASNTTPYAGEPVTLTVTLSGADSATLEPGFGSIDPAGGDFQVAVDDTTTFALTATNSAGTTTRLLKITPLPPAVEISASPDHLLPHEKVDLQVTVLGAQSASLEPGFGSIHGSGIYRSPVHRTTTFVLTATNPLATVRDSVTVTVTPPLIGAFGISRSQVLVAEADTLFWSVEGADSLFIESTAVTDPLEIAQPTGTLEVFPWITTTYTLHALNVQGESTAQVTVEVLPFAVRFFLADPAVVNPGESTTLRWRVDGSGRAELALFGAVPMIGNLVVHPVEPTTYVLRVMEGGLLREATADVGIRMGTSGSIAPSWSGIEYPGNPPFIAPGFLFNVHVLALDPPGGLSSYEFGFEFSPGLLPLFDLATHPGTVTELGYAQFRGEIPDCVPQQPIVRLFTIPILVLSLEPDSHIAVTGVAASSFAGSPGRVDCDGFAIPFNIGDPLPVIENLGDGGAVPAMVIDLEAVRSGDTVKISWRIAQLARLDELVLVRREDGEPHILAEWKGPEALTRGTWIDRVPAGTGPTTYRLFADLGGEILTSNEVPLRDASPSARSMHSYLQSNVPNPFNPSTEIRFFLTARGPVEIAIYGPSGRRVRVLRSASLPAGPGALTWDGCDDAGTPVASGVYLVRLRADDAVDSRHVTLLK